MKQSARIASPSPTYHHASPSQTNSSSSARQPLMRYTANNSRRSSAVNYSKGTTTNDVFLQPPPHQHQQSSSPPPPLKPQVFSRTGNSKNNPNFEKDFGPFGTVISERSSKDQGDINAMFSRRGNDFTVIERSSGSGVRLSGGFRVTMNDDDSNSGSVQPGWGITTTVSKDASACSTLPPTNTPPIGVQNNRNRTHEQLDRILAKYGKDLKEQADSHQHHPQGPGPGPGIHGGYWDTHHPVEVSPGRRRIIVHAQKSLDNLNGNVVVQVDDKKQQHQQHDEEPVVLRRSTHVFPFKETQTGLLVVDPSQIAFENRKLSVLVADPNNNSSSDNHKLLQEVRRAMCLAVDSSTGEEIKSSKAVQGKELISKKYSDSKKATEEFEQKLLQKLISGRNSDTHVVIGDKVFPCHGVALEVFSSYFDKLGREQQAIQKVQLNEVRS